MSRALAGLTVIVARDDAPDDDISAALVREGANVVPLPLMRTERIDDVATTTRLEAGLARADVVAVTSRQVAEALEALRPSPTTLVAAVGAATAEALRRRGWKVDLVGDGGGSALAERLRGLVAGRRVLLPRAEGAHGGLEAGLRADGADVEVVDVYRALPNDADVAIDSAFSRPRPLAIVLTSPRRVQQLVTRGPVPPDVLVVAIGDTTAEACRAAGLVVHATPERPAPDPVCAALVRLHTPS